MLLIVPVEEADVIEHLGWGRRTRLTPNGLQIAKADLSIGSQSLTALLLTAYQYALR